MLPSRQLAEETDEDAKKRLAQIEHEMEEQKRLLASLREQWEAERSGLNDVQKVRQELEQAKHEYSRRESEIQQLMSSGGRPAEEDFQALRQLFDRPDAEVDRHVLELVVERLDPSFAHSVLVYVSLFR